MDDDYDDYRFDFTDSKGCQWRSAREWLFMGVLGGCGCGSSRHFSATAEEVLAMAAAPFPRETWISEGEQELMAHWMADKGLTEHGGSVYGSWLTPSGGEVWQAIIVGAMFR